MMFLVSSVSGAQNYVEIAHNTTREFTGWEWCCVICALYVVNKIAFILQVCVRVY